MNGMLPFKLKSARLPTAEARDGKAALEGCSRDIGKETANGRSLQSLFAQRDCEADQGVSFSVPLGPAFGAGVKVGLDAPGGRGRAAGSGR